MITAKANVFLSLLKFIDADWWKIFDVMSCCNRPEIDHIKMIFVQNSWSLKSDNVSDWPLPNKISACATALKINLNT